MKNKTQRCDTGINQTSTANDKSWHARNQTPASPSRTHRKYSPGNPVLQNQQMLTPLPFASSKALPKGSSSRTVSGREVAQQVGTRWVQEDKEREGGPISRVSGVFGPVSASVLSARGSTQAAMHLYSHVHNKAWRGISPALHAYLGSLGPKKMSIRTRLTSI